VSERQADRGRPDIDVRTGVERDTRDLFETVFVEPNGEFWPPNQPFVPREGEDREAGFQPYPGFGRDGVVIAAPAPGAEGPVSHVFMRWRWTGIDRPHPDRRGRRLPNRGTGNWVTVDGLTILEVTGGEIDVDGERIVAPERIYARRLVDWLSVYAQLGLVLEGRPVGLPSTVVTSATEFFGTRPLAPDAED
jgi:hypothetical protein